MSETSQRIGVYLMGDDDREEYYQFDRNDFKKMMFLLKMCFYVVPTNTVLYDELELIQGKLPDMQ